MIWLTGGRKDFHYRLKELGLPRIRENIGLFVQTPFYANIEGNILKKLWIGQKRKLKDNFKYARDIKANIRKF